MRSPSCTTSLGVPGCSYGNSRQAAWVWGPPAGWGWGCGKVLEVEWLPRLHHGPDESGRDMHLHVGFKGFCILAGQPVPWKHLPARVGLGSSSQLCCFSAGGFISFQLHISLYNQCRVWDGVVRQLEDILPSGTYQTSLGSPSPSTSLTPP